MGAIRMGEDGKSFELTYGGHELPFLGLDISAPPAYVMPGAFPSLTNALVVDKAIQAVGLVPFYDTVANNPRPLDTNLGIGDLNGVIFEVYLDNASPPNIRVYTYVGINGVGSNPTLIGTIATTTTLTIGGLAAGTLAYKNINGICYFTFGNNDSIYQHNNSSVSVLTSYLGGAIIGELNGRLLVFNVSQTTGGVTTNFPYRGAWSAPLGNYAQFNPLVGGLVTGAGFNDLPDVEDMITGFFTTGPTGYVLRKQGITEMTPLSSGINPFDFNHMWASHKGIGAVNPGTVAQFGSAGIFGSSTDIFTLGYDGLNQIAEMIKPVVMPLVLSSYTAPTKSVKSAFGPVIVNNHPMLAYIIGYSDPTALYGIYVYIFTLKQWFFLQLDLAITGPLFVNIASLNVVYTVSTPTLNDIFIYEVVTSTKNYFFTIRGDFLNQTLTTLVFPLEELIFLHDITIDGIGMNIYSENGGLLHFSISGTAFSDVALTAGWNYYRTFPVNNLFTGVSPQLIITNDAGVDFRLGKIVLYGSLDSSQRPL